MIIKRARDTFYFYLLLLFFYRGKRERERGGRKKTVLNADAEISRTANDKTRRYYRMKTRLPDGRDLETEVVEINDVHDRFRSFFHREHRYVRARFHVIRRRRRFNVLSHTSDPGPRSVRGSSVYSETWTYCFSMYIYPHTSDPSPVRGFRGHSDRNNIVVSDRFSVRARTVKHGTGCRIGHVWTGVRVHVRRLLLQRL